MQLKEITAKQFMGTLKDPLRQEALDVYAVVRNGLIGKYVVGQPIVGETGTMNDHTVKFHIDMPVDKDSKERYWYLKTLKGKIRNILKKMGKENSVKVAATMHDQSVTLWFHKREAHEA